MRKFHYNSFFVAFFAYVVFIERMILIWQIIVTQIYMSMVRKRSWQTSLKSSSAGRAKMSANRKLPLAAAGSASSLRAPAYRPLISALAFQFDGKERLYICYTSAWEAQAEFWKAVLRKFAPACKFYYLSEESCQGLYVTNDKFRRVITADYAIPAWDSAAGCYLPSELRRSTVYTEEAMRELLSSRYGSAKSTAELLELARRDGLPVYEVKRGA